MARALSRDIKKLQTKIKEWQTKLQGTQDDAAKAVLSDINSTLTSWESSDESGPNIGYHIKTTF